MSDVRPLAWFWIVSIIGLLWNLIGVMAFVNDVFFLDQQTLDELQRDFYEGRQTWALAAYGVAVFGGALGCLALLLRKTWALPMLLVCLTGIVVQNIHGLVQGNGLEAFGPQGLVLPVLVFSIALVLAWFAHFARGAAG